MLASRRKNNAASPSKQQQQQQQQHTAAHHAYGSTPSRPVTADGHAETRSPPPSGQHDRTPYEDRLQGYNNAQEDRPFAYSHVNASSSSSVSPYGSASPPSRDGPPLMGAGSRSKILHQLGENVETLAQPHHPKALVHGGTTSPSNGAGGRNGSAMSSVTNSTGSYHAFASPGPSRRDPSPGAAPSSASTISQLQSQTTTTPPQSRPKHFRKLSSTPKLSFANVYPTPGPNSGISPTTLAPAMTSAAQGTQQLQHPSLHTSQSTGSAFSYFDFPQPSPSTSVKAGSSLYTGGATSPESATTRFSPSNTFKLTPSKAATPSAMRTHSHSPGIHGYKIGLPPVDASPRTIFSGSPNPGGDGNSGDNPKLASSASIDGELARGGGVVALSSSPVSNGMVAPVRKPSLSDLDPRPATSHGDMMAAPFTSHNRPSGSVGKSADPDMIADDGQLEEIVPWLYQSNDGKRPSSPSTLSSPPRSRNTSLAANSSRPTVSHILRGSKSHGNVKSLGRSESTMSLDSNGVGSGGGLPVPERDRKHGGRFMGMLRKKSSAIAVNLSDVLGTHKEDATGADVSPVPDRGRHGSIFSNNALSMTSAGNKIGSRPRMSPRSHTTLPEGDSAKGKKGNKKDKKRENSLPERPGQLPTGHTGFSLDTNLDEMEGIVNLDNLQQPFPKGYSVASPYDHMNAVTVNTNASNSPRPGTPPSPSQLHGLRRPSLAGSQRYEFIPAAEGVRPDMSPLSKRLGITRRDSVDVLGTMTRWSANGGLGAGLGFANNVTQPPSDSSRKPSITSLLANDRRGSDGTVNGVPSAPDAGWTAPDSWAVKPSIKQVPPEDDSDEEFQMAVNDKASGSQPPTPHIGGEPEYDSSGRLMTTRRPGTSSSAFGAGFGHSKAATMMGSIRIFKLDNAHTILNAPFHSTVAELIAMVGKKPGFVPANSKLPLNGYRMYCRARGLERVMASSEKPLLWQDRKFRAAGYDPETDRLEELGREDNSYLVKFIFKPEYLPTLRVEEEGFEGFDYIDLAGRQIENLPIFLYKHAHEIISLNISRNSRLHLPADFVQLCTSLRDLKMVEMGLKRIPHSVRQISGLTRLDVSINRIVDLEHCALDETRELTTLHVHNNRIQSLPDYFVRFQALKYLNISNNRFETFPVVVCEVASLNDLDISFNSLTSVPPEIGKLHNLERLILLSNNITTLPGTMNQLKRLRELDCRRNFIIDFSPVDTLPNLQTVRAQHNMSKALEMRTGNLAILNLSHNAVTRFSVSAGTTPSNLTHLDLSYARLETIPEELYSLCTSLQLLVLSDNKIRALSESIGKLSKLSRVSVNNNALQSLPRSLGKLQSLHTLDASNNKIASVPESIWLCSELTELNLSSNDIIELPDPPQMQQGYAADNEWRMSSAAATLPTATPLSLSLKKLFLAYNRVRDDAFRPISLLSSLSTLNVSSNDIYEIPPQLLSKCSHLTHLYLSGNMLTSLPVDDLERLTNLRVLHLNGNKLQTLPAELGKITTLHVLDVGNNALKYNIANWPFDWNWNWNLELRYLNLSGNKRLEIKSSGQTNQELDPSGIRKRNLADFTALQKIRVLGLMDVTLMIPSVPDETDDRRVRTSLSSINEMGYGVADSLGRSDHLSMMDMVVPKFRGKDDECVIGLFDAGCYERTTGSKITKFIVDHFVQRLTLELSRLRDEDASQGLRRTFLSLNRDWGNSIAPAYDRGRKESDIRGSGERFAHHQIAQSAEVASGASAVVMYVYKKTLYLANVGDSLAIIAGRTMIPRLLSSKHDPLAPEEVTRIRSCEGWISPRGLVNDISDTARAFGRLNVFPAVNCEPAIHVLDLVDSDEFVIIANRGLWDALSYQAAVDVAWMHREDPMLAAQKLRDMAIAYGAEESVMVMVISVGDLFKNKRSNVSKGLTGYSNRSDYYDKSFMARRPQQGSIPGMRVLNEAAVAPQGTVALVFTDIRNSTALWETNPGMQNAMRIHHELMRRLIRAFDGYEVKTEGDAFMVSFASITSAVLWCFTVQLELLRCDWPVELLMSEEGKELYNANGEVIYRGLSVRMGLHWGTPICEQDPVNHRMDYLGPMVNRAARVSGVAEGGQVAASADAVEVLRALMSTVNEDDDESSQPLVDPDELDAATKRDIAAIRHLGFTITELGERKLKGLETPEFLSLIWPHGLISRLQEASPTKPENAKGVVDIVTGLRAESPTIPMINANQDSLLDVQEVRTLNNLCLRLEALSAGPGHRLYDAPSSSFSLFPNATVGTSAASAAGAIAGPATTLAIPSVLSSHHHHQQQQHPASPSVGYHTSAGAVGPIVAAASTGPRRRVTLSPHLLAAANTIRQDTPTDQLLVMVELLVIRIENVISTLHARQMGPLNDVLYALSDAIKVEPQFIRRALSMLSQLL